MATTFLRWAGSKRQIIGTLAQYWPGGKTRYIEPFAGSASLFFELEPVSAVIGDINQDLIAMYKTVRDRPVAVHDSLSRWKNDAEVYYQVRAMKPPELSSVDRAARFIFLNRYCFNGLYRTNGSGLFNVPYGGRKSGSVPSADALCKASKLLARASLISGDFEVVVKDVRKGDFVYLDPPFSETDHRTFTQYGAQPFGERDLTRLRTVMKNVDAVGATFLLSYADCVSGRKLSEDYQTLVVSTRRNIAGFAGHRRSAAELIVTNQPDGEGESE